MPKIPWRQKSHEPLAEETAPMSEFGRELDRLFESYIHDPWQRALGSLGAAFPAVDLTESDDAVIIRAELPGIDHNDVDLTVVGDAITIAGEKTASDEEYSKHHYHRNECCYGSFRRTIHLPVSIDPEQVSAESLNGVLSIRMQKREVSKSTKIKVNVS